MKYLPIDKDLFVRNRAKFAEKMAPNSMAIFNSNDIYPISADSTLPFAQHRDIFYDCGAGSMLTTMGCDAVCDNPYDACIRSHSSFSSCQDSDLGQGQRDSAGCVWQCINGLYDGEDNATTLNLGRLVDKQHHLLFDQIQRFQVRSKVQSIQFSPPLPSSVKFFKDSWELSEHIRNM